MFTSLISAAGELSVSTLLLCTAAALACGRDPGEIALCAATKMNDAEAVRQAIAAGVDCCGENRVQEAKEKRTIVPDRGF